MHEDSRRLREMHDLRAGRFLGEGWQGRTYLVQRPDGTPAVAKVFHRVMDQKRDADALNSVTSLALRRYAATVPATVEGLYPIQLLEDARGVVGMVTPYEPLTPIFSPATQIPGVVHALLAAYCRSQVYLMRHMGLAWRQAEGMLSLDGQIRWVDYDFTLLPPHGDEIPPKWLDWRFFDFLFVQYRQYRGWLRANQRSSPARADQPSVYGQSGPLLEIIERDPILRDRLGWLREQPARVFCEPETYECIADGLNPVLKPWQTQGIRLVAAARDLREKFGLQSPGNRQAEQALKQWLKYLEEMDQRAD